MQMFTILGVCGVLLVGVWGEKAAPGLNDKECTFWNQLANNLSHVHEQTGDFLHMACTSTCLEIQCSGRMKPQFSLLMKDAVIDFCFGVQLDNCKTEPTMNYYLSIPKKNQTMQGAITHNDSFETPSANLPGGRGTVLVTVEMVRVNRSYIMFGISGSVKVTIAGQSFFPYKEKVFPPTLIDVPACDKTKPALATLVPPKNCTAPPPPATKTTAKPVVIKSDTYNKSCELAIGQCSQNEMCRSVSLNSKRKNGICHCATFAKLDPKTGKCETTETTIVPAVITMVTTVNPPMITNSSKVKSTEEKSGMNWTPVIVGSVAGGVLLVVVVGTVIACVGRRKRMSIYRDRQQLLTDDIDDDDHGNVVI